MRWKRWTRWRRVRKKRRDIRSLIAGLASRDPAQRYASEKVLLELGPEGVGLLLAELKRMSSVPRQLPMTLGYALVAGISFNCIWLLCGGPEGLAMFPVAVALTVMVRQIHLNRNAAARLLAQVEDRRIVGPLTEAMAYGDAPTRDAARQCLLRLLPLLTIADGRMLASRHRRRLNRTLGGEDEPMILAILEALPQIGDSSFLGQVQGLLRYGGTVRVKRAAKECLPLLEFRIQELKSSETLLRPSDGADFTGETLVRPVLFAPDADPLQLLRPVLNEG